MSPKVREKKANGQHINKVVVAISDDEKAYLNAFFGLVGMIQSFLEANTQHKRRHLDYALDKGSFKFGLLTDVRAFVNENKEKVSEFLNKDVKDPYENGK